MSPVPCEKAYVIEDIRIMAGVHGSRIEKLEKDGEWMLSKMSTAITLIICTLLSSLGGLLMIFAYTLKDYLLK